VFNIGPLELIVVLIIALLVLGPQRLPDAAKSVGRGLREFRGALSMDHDEEDDYEHRPPASPQAETVKTPEQAAAAKPPTPAQ
jgi:sec-independent protein translocase protein TatA